MQIDGPAVFSLDVVFATDWFLETNEALRDDVQQHTYEKELGDVLCQVVPSGPGFPDENNLRLFNSLIYSAQRRLSITSPYFVPDESLLYAITTAAQRGIEVELFVGEQVISSWSTMPRTPTRGSAENRRQDLPLPCPVRVALQALLRR
jgi:cardiolipin synthase A/B